MGEPRTTTLDDLTQYDIDHLVRFRRPDPDLRGRRIAQGFLVAFTPATYQRGMMPRPGFIIRLTSRENASFLDRTGFEEHGPLPAQHKIEILPTRRAPRRRALAGSARQHVIGSGVKPDRQRDSADLTEAMQRLREYAAGTQDTD